MDIGDITDTSSHPLNKIILLDFLKGMHCQMDGISLGFNDQRN